MNAVRENILGVSASAINLDMAVRQSESFLDNGSSHYVCVTSAHGILLAQEDDYFRRILNASAMTTPDGMSLVWLLRIRGHREVARVYGPDLMLAVCERSMEEGWRHFLYGGAPGIADRLRNVLEERFPGFQIVGTYCPPFRPLTENEDREVVEIIQRSKADIVWVGISTPKQEYWMAEHVDKLGVPLLIGVGAAFDFISGAKRQAPRWIQRSGFEWLFRLLSEPRRLWPRYRQYPRFVALALAQLLGLKEFPVDT